MPDEPAREALANQLIRDTREELAALSEAEEADLDRVLKQGILREDITGLVTRMACVAIGILDSATFERRRGAK